MKRLTLFLAAILLASSFSTLAQEGPEGNVAEAWIVNVDMASQPAFEEAFKAHIDVRKKHNDPFEWDVYVQETGDSMSTYMVRACCFAWAEKDAYETWASENPEVSADWGQYVHPHVSSYGHHYSTLDFANTHWPEDGAEINFVGVTTYKIKTGHSAQFEAAKAEMSQIALNEGWADAGHHWAWTSSVDGANMVNLAVPHENYASMATPDPDYFQFLSQHLGSEEAAAEIFQRFTGATDGSDYTIYRHRSDLSMSDSDQ